jgi:hypothetical protein
MVSGDPSSELKASDSRGAARLASAQVMSYHVLSVGFLTIKKPLQEQVKKKGLTTIQDGPSHPGPFSAATLI